MAKEKSKLSGVKFVTPPFRLSFPHLFEPHLAPRAKEPKYSITMLIPKEDAETRKEIDKQLRAAAAEAWGKDPKKWPKIRWPWRDGDRKSQYKGYEGHMTLTADTNNPPGIVDRKLNDILNQREVYAGCYCRAQVVAKAVPGIGEDDEGNPKNFVKLYLQHVMFWEKGEAFSQGGDPKKAFASFADEDGEIEEVGDGDDSGSFAEDEINVGF